MSHWLSERVQCIFLRPDAGPSRLTCRHRYRCDCDRPPPPPPPTPAPKAEPAPKPEPGRLRTWKDVVDSSGEWRDTVTAIMNAIRRFPDAVKAVLAALDPGDQVDRWRYSVSGQ